MFFRELETLVREHQDLRWAAKQVDQQLSRMLTPAPLRPGDFACALGADENQILSLFEFLRQHDVLSIEEMVACEQCQTLVPAKSFQQAVKDEDPLECSGCGLVFPRRSKPQPYYRMASRALIRTQAAAESSATTREPMVPSVGDSKHGVSAHRDTFTIEASGRSLTISGRSKLLFSLFERIFRRPGHQVSFDSLRQKGDVWGDVQVEDVTIRGAVGRLKKALRNAGMNDLAAAISTGRFQNQPFVILDFARSNSN